MKENSPLQDMCPEKRLSNHSVRITVVRKLKAREVPKLEIITIAGHRQEQSVEAQGAHTSSKSGCLFAK